jgi:prepilin-type N-terminal cleavage/methylation domain-containing protein
MKRHIKKGFTLLEMMVAVAIVGILLFFAVPAYQNYTTRARVAEALEFADAARTRVEVDMESGIQPPTDLLDSGGKKVDMMTALSWNPGKPGDSLVGYILAEMDLPGIGARKVFALEKRSDGVWHCVGAAAYAGAGQALESNKLPANCREGGNSAMAKAAPPATSCPAGQVMTTATDTNGVSHSVCEPASAPNSCPAGQVSIKTGGSDVCVPACPSGQAHDAMLKCCASSNLINFNGMQVCDPTAAPSPVPAPTPAAAVPAAAPTVPTAYVLPSQANNPCSASEVFVPSTVQSSYDWAAGVPGSCQPKPKGMSDPYATVECAVCKVPNAPGLCMVLINQTMCAWPNNVCINEVTNSANGSKVMDRRCGHYKEANDDWWHSTSDNPDCQDYKPNENTEKDIHCTYACTTANCNSNVKPDQDTLWVDSK